MDHIGYKGPVGHIGHKGPVGHIDPAGHKVMQAMPVPHGMPIVRNACVSQELRKSWVSRWSPRSGRSQGSHGLQKSHGLLGKPDNQSQE